MAEKIEASQVGTMPSLHKHSMFSSADLMKQLSNNLNIFYWQYMSVLRNGIASVKVMIVPRA